MRLIDADEVIQFPFSPESGTDEWIDDLISEVGLSGEAVDFDCEIEEKAQELCKKVIEGMLNIIKTVDTVYDPDNIITSIAKTTIKVGDTVYIVAKDFDDKGGEVIECKVTKMTVKKRFTFSVKGHYKSGYIYRASFTENSIGEKAFLSRAEANMQIKS